MKLPKNFTTSIDELLITSNDKTIFLSTWDRTISKDDVPLEIINKSTNISLKEINKYQYMDEMQKVKDNIARSISSVEKIPISSNNFAIAANGTASSYLILRTINQNKKIRPLLLTPIYFSYMSSLKDFCKSIEFYQIYKLNNIHIDFPEIENIIWKNHINLIVVNDPVFGCGVSLKNEDYEKIIYLCQKYRITLIIDYIYGGMSWRGEKHYIHRYLMEQINAGKDIVMIDSISKRLFINGIKGAIIYGESTFIDQIEKASVYTLGCMVYSQISLLKELYSPSNKKIIDGIINNNICHAKNNYELIRGLILEKDYYLDECDSGFFALFKIPYKKFGSNSNMHIAKLILNKCNVITIPHDRYLYFNYDEYCFRINLLSSKIDLIQGIEAIIKEFD